jgi:hypothetical protein
MSDSTQDNNDWYANYRQRNAAAQAKAAATLKASIAAFGKLGLDSVRWSYDGSGDSGGIEAVTFVKTPVEDTPGGAPEAVMSDTEFEAEVKAKLSAEEQALIDESALNDAVFGLMPSGFENNDGGYGEVVLDVVTGAIQVQHNERYTEVNYSETNY